MSRFTQHIKATGAGDRYHVLTQDAAGRDCWFLLKMTARSLVRLKQAQRTDRIDLTSYGDVLKSGWGHVPAEA